MAPGAGALYGRRAMDIVFITAEVAPISGDGPAALVAQALPKALRGLDHKVTVLSPLYRQVDPGALSLARRLSKVEVEVDGESYALEVYDGRSAAGVELTFLGHEELFKSTDAIEDADQALTAKRAGVFAKGAAGLLAIREYELAHGIGWVGAGAISAVAAHEGCQSLLKVVTVTDGASGAFDASLAKVTGLDADALAVEGGINFFAAGLRAANRSATMSPGYARALNADGATSPLAAVAAALEAPLEGILHGVDVSVWNPVTDSLLPSRFDPIERSGKARCKSDVQRGLELPVRDDVPLLFAYGSGAANDGLELLADATPALVRNDVQLVVCLKEDDSELADRFTELSTRWPDRVQLRSGAGKELIHSATAAADLAVVPCRSGASAHWVMVAQRYGAAPIAHAVGALADAVVDCDAALETGTGFLFEEPSEESLLAALRRAVASFTKGEAFSALQSRVMQLDFSWERSARMHEMVYRDAAGPDEEEAAGEDAEAAAGDDA